MCMFDDLDEWLKLILKYLTLNMKKKKFKLLQTKNRHKKRKLLFSDYCNS